MVFGRKGGIFAGWYASATQEKVIRVVGNGQNHWSCVHVDDLADLYRRAIEEPAPGEVFIGCSGMPQVTKKLAEAVQRATGGDAAIEYIPVAQARATFGPMADCLAMDCKAGSTKPARFFGWGPQRANVIAMLEEGNN